MALSYVLITPCRNEGAYIEGVLRSVIRQTVLPTKWVVVDDGSDDDSAAIVRRYQEGRPWLILVQRPPRSSRHFAAKVQAIRAGLDELNGVDYDVIGCLDADVSFAKDYFEFLLGRFEESPNLGVAGTDYVEGEFHSFRDSYISAEHVNGQVQLFRRRCFEEIGGYVPIRDGGIDWVAVTTARMMGWKSRSFSERVFHHHKPMGGAKGGALARSFSFGRKDYGLGGHPLWELLRGIFQMIRRPYVLGGGALLLGYFTCWIRRRPISVSKDLMRFHRNEQMTRLRGLACRPFSVIGRKTGTESEKTV